MQALLTFTASAGWAVLAVLALVATDALASLFQPRRRGRRSRGKLDMVRERRWIRGMADRHDQGYTR